MDMRTPCPVRQVITVWAAIGLLAACSDDSESEETPDASGGSAAVSVPAASSSAPGGPTSTLLPATTAPSSSLPSSGAPDVADTGVGFQLVADGLTAPIGMVVPPGEPQRRLVVDQAGMVMELSADDQLAEQPFLDVSGKIVELNEQRDDERGLLGLAFHPQWQDNRRVFAFYTAEPPEDADSAVDHVNVVSEFTVTEDGAGVDPNSEKVLLSFEQEGGSHAAGQLAFELEGTMLVFVGDGLDNDAAQDPDSLFGKVLRLDVDSRQQPQPQIVASGLRHPWRLSQYAGATLIAEPNFTARFQEVNVFEQGANYGWDLEIAEECYPLEPEPSDPSCGQGPGGERLTLPVAEYGGDLGLIISGARIYSGDDIPALQGQLIISEWGVSSAGRGTPGSLLIADASGNPPWRVSQLQTSDEATANGGMFWALGQDGEGELYVLTMDDIAPVPGDGAVYKLVPTDA